MRPFFIVLACVWIALLGTAVYYSHQHPQFHWIMSAALPAFAVEIFFYLASVSEVTRIWFGRLRPHAAQAALLWVSAILPFLIFSFAAGTFQRNAFALLAVLCAVVAFWPVVMPRRLTYDVGFLVIAAAPILMRTFRRIYVSPDTHLQIEILGHLMWIRLGIAAWLVLREWNPGAFGFWPTWREWRIGFLYFAIILGPIVALGLAIHDVRFAPLQGPWWFVTGAAIGYFCGVLWVVALSEELLFRGVIERALLETGSSRVMAVSVSAVLFGSAHLWFHQFPDWRQFSVATLVGVSCGMGYAQTGSVRAAMVTHASLVAIWRVLFRNS